MSFDVAPVVPQNPANLPQPTGGETVAAGSDVGITSPSTTSTPVIITGGTESAPTELVIGTQSAQVILQSGVTRIGIAVNSAGNPLSMAGAVIQAQDSSTGGKVVNLEGANVNSGVVVDGGIDLGAQGRGGSGTIASNAPAGTFSAGKLLPSAQALIAAVFPTNNQDILLAGNPPATYIHTGAGNDQIEGSEGIDFIRAGAGNDIINSGGGNDIVRAGSGSDSITLGTGNDVLYYTVDQIQGISTDTISDFNAVGSGADLIQIKKDLQSFIRIDGIGTSQIVLNYAQAGLTGTTTIINQAGIIKTTDIQFV